MNTFVCAWCRREKPNEELSRSGSRPSPACKPCLAEYHRRRYRVNPVLRKNAALYARARRAAAGRLQEHHPEEFLALLDTELARQREEIAS